MKRVDLNECKVINLRKIEDNSGAITPVENDLDLPFNVKRVFYLYDIKGNESRGNHAHKECHQFLIAASGSFDVVIDNGLEKEEIRLSNPNYGLHIPPGIWATEINFSSGAICLVLASHGYDEEDYFRDYKTFLNIFND